MGAIQYTKYNIYTKIIQAFQASNLLQLRKSDFWHVFLQINSVRESESSKKHGGGICWDIIETFTSWRSVVFGNPLLSISYGMRRKVLKYCWDNYLFKNSKVANNCSAWARGWGGKYKKYKKYLLKYVSIWEVRGVWQPIVQHKEVDLPLYYLNLSPSPTCFAKYVFCIRGIRYAAVMYNVEHSWHKQS